MKLGSIVFLGIVGLVATGAGCSSGSSGGGGGSGSCDQEGGSWNISGSCTASTCVISQNGCSMSMSCNDGNNFNGSLSGSSVSFSNSTTSCSGTLSGSTGSGTCTSQGSTCNWSGTKIGGSGGSGGGGGSGGSGGSGGGSGGGGGTACKSCLQSKCASTLSACQNNPDCANLASCIANCSDSTCQNNCETQYPNGVSDMNAYLNCASSSCKTECGF